MKAPCREHQTQRNGNTHRQWKPTKETLDLEALIAADGRAPRFEESVDLWRDDLDPHSFGFFRVRVRAHERFWVAYSRFFIRVNGVRARVIDARFAGFGDRVLRERSWREGDWTAVAGAGAPPCVDLGGLLRRPANTSRLLLERRGHCGGGESRRTTFMPSTLAAGRSENAKRGSRRREEDQTT